MTIKHLCKAGTHNLRFFKPHALLTGCSTADASGGEEYSQTS